MKSQRTMWRFGSSLYPCRESIERTSEPEITPESQICQYPFGFRSSSQRQPSCMTNFESRVPARIAFEAGTAMIDARAGRERLDRRNNGEQPCRFCNLPIGQASRLFSWRDRGRSRPVDRARGPDRPQRRRRRLSGRYGCAGADRAGTDHPTAQGSRRGTRSISFASSGMSPARASTRLLAPALVRPGKTRSAGTSHPRRCCIFPGWSIRARRWKSK